MEHHSSSNNQALESSEKKGYHFEHLSGPAKQVATEQVKRKELHMHWERHNRTLHRDIERIFLSAGIETKHVEWSNSQHSLRLSGVSIDDSYIKKVLSEEDYELYQLLRDISGFGMTGYLFQKAYNETGYTLIFKVEKEHQYLSDAEEMQFILDYSEDQEMKDRYKFPLLLIESEYDNDYKNKVSFKEYLEFCADIKKVGKRCAKQLSAKISDALEPVYRQVYNRIHSLEFIKSLPDSYYYNALEEKSPSFAHYRFNQEGLIYQ